MLCFFRSKACTKEGALLFRIVLGIHLTSASAWVGGSLFFLLVLRPALKGRNAGGLAASISVAFREVSEVAMWVVIGSGLLLTVERLTLANLQPIYLGVLALKLVLVTWMVLIALNLWARVTGPRAGTGPSVSVHAIPRVLRAAGSPTMQTVLGVLVVLLGETLRVLYGRSL